ncbi:MAG: hypothetical protein ACC628_04165 [Pirellulaceae bacterium]
MRRLAVILAVSLVVSVSSVAQADWGEFWYRVHMDLRRMTCWPEPFANVDRQVTMQPLMAMTDAGWQRQNTLSDHFFDPEKQVLSRAGEMKVRWIATQAPMHRRTVFVLRDLKAEATLARVETVKNYLNRLIPEGPRPDVLLTDTIPPGASGDYFDQVDRQLKSSIPAPRLPEMQSMTDGGG